MLLRAVLISSLVLPSCLASSPEVKPAPAPAPVKPAVVFLDDNGPEEEQVYVCGKMDGQFKCITWETFLALRQLDAEEGPAVEPQSYDSGLIDL